MHNYMQVEDIGDDNTPWQQDAIDAEMGSLFSNLLPVAGGIIGTAIGGPGLGTAIGIGGGKLIGSVVTKAGKRKKVVSISGRTEMTPEGQLADRAVVSNPIPGASGTTPVSEIAMQAGLAHIQTTLDRSEAQRMALIAQARDNKFHKTLLRGNKTIIKKLTALAACQCKKNTGAMARFRAALGL